MKTVAYTSAARRQLKKLPPAAQDRLRAAVSAYAAGEGRAEKLEGREGYKIRAGDYRAVVSFDALTVTVLAVADRKEIYR